MTRLEWLLASAPELSLRRLAGFVGLPLVVDAGVHLAAGTWPSGHDLLHLAISTAAIAGFGLLGIRAMARGRQAERWHENLINVLQEGVWAVDEQGRTTFVNAKLAEMLGYAAAEMQGRSVLDCVAVPDQARVREQLARRQQGFRDEYEIELLRRDGGCSPVRVRAAPLLEDGVYKGSIAAIADVSRQRQAIAEQRAARQQLESTLDALPDLMFEVDEAGVIHDYRAPYSERLSLPPTEFLGRSLQEVLPEAVASRIAAGIATAREQGHAHGIVYSLTTPLGTRWFELSVARRGGEPALRFVALAREISALVRANEELADSQRVAGVGTYDLDLARGHWSCSPVLEQIFGIPADYDKTIEGWQRLVHPDHRATMVAYFRDEVVGGRRAFHKEYMILRPDGILRWVDGRGQLRLAADGTPLRMTGAIRDITDNKLKELRIGEYAERQRLTFERTLQGWVRALATHESETAGHSERVVVTTRHLAKAFGLEGPELETILHGALLHDIGKIGIPGSVLTKPGKLTAEEWDLVRSHPARGRDFLATIPGLERSAEIVYSHHEHWGGGGYPRGLAGDEIPFGALLFSVADVWDALTSPRAYRSHVYSRAEAATLIQEESGRLHCPRVVDVFVELLDRGVL